MTEVFRAVLQARGPGGAWTCLVVPFDVARVFGTRGLAASHRREYAEWVASAKRADTRVRRAVAAIGKLLGGAWRR